MSTDTIAPALTGAPAKPAGPRRGRARRRRENAAGYLFMTPWMIGFALIVVGLAAATAFRAIGRHRDEPTLRRLGHAALHTVLLQLALGVVTLVGVLPYESGKTDPLWVVTVATAHQGIGALLLALAALMFAWSMRPVLRPQAAL